MKWGCYMGYLHCNKEQFKEAIDLVVYQTGISPEVVEKDYYVTMILKSLAEKVTYIVFKGGTSLSKCHKIIKRFSEDIDISVDESISQGQRKKIKDAIVETATMLDMNIDNLDETKSRRNYNKYIVSYDSVVSTETVSISRTVIIETSLAVLSFPVQMMQVDNYIGKMMKKEAPQLIDHYGLNPFEMKVQQIDRTLVEKVFAICDYYLKEEFHKYSRHLYDIYKLYPLVPQNEAFRLLINEVRKIRKSSASCPSAQDNISITELLRRIVDEEVFKNDYKTVTEYLLNEVVSYDETMDVIRKIIESRIFE